MRTRKERIPPGADERDRALFDIPSQHSVVFLDPQADQQSKAFRDQ